MFALRRFESLEQIGLYFGKVLSFKDEADRNARLMDGRTISREQNTYLSMSFLMAGMPILYVYILALDTI